GFHFCLSAVLDGDQFLTPRWPGLCRCLSVVSIRTIARKLQHIVCGRTLWTLVPKLNCSDGRLCHHSSFSLHNRRLCFGEVSLPIPKFAVHVDPGLPDDSIPSAYRVPLSDDYPAWPGRNVLGGHYSHRGISNWSLFLPPVYAFD